MEEKQKETDILELIPRRRLSLKKGTFQPENRRHVWPIYKLLWEPSNLDEFDWRKHLHPYPNSFNLLGISIWRENKTLTCVTEQYPSPMYKEKSLSFTIYCSGKSPLQFTVYGETDAAIAETATFFWSLRYAEDRKTRLEIGSYDSSRPIDFATAFQPEQLARMFEANPTRRIKLSRVYVSAAQSTILASQPHRVELEFCEFLDSTGNCFCIADRGTAFVNALTKRTSSFGTLKFSFRDTRWSLKCLNLHNLKRLLELEVFEKLTFDALDKNSALLPFSARVHTLEYKIDAEHVKAEDFSSLDIRAKDLSLTVYSEGGIESDYDDYMQGDDAEDEEWDAEGRQRVDTEGDEWDVILISFLDRVAALGHFESLRFGIGFRRGRNAWFEYDYSTVVPIRKALIRAIEANQNLRHLDLSTTDSALNWTPHLELIFKSMGNHKGLRTFKVQEYSPRKVWSEEIGDYYDEGYCWLKWLLSRNRKITVYDKTGEVCSDQSVDQLYARNRFYNGSETLAKESPLVQQKLVATALVQSASKNFQYSAFLLSSNKDTLCKLVQSVNLEELPVSEPVPEETVLRYSVPGSDRVYTLKRPMTSQLPHAVKRTAGREP